MKLNALQQHLSDKHIDVALFFNTDPHITYFTGATPEYACLAIPAKGKPALYIPGFEAERIARQTRCKVINPGKNFFESIYRAFSAKKIGVISKHLSYATAKHIQKQWKAKLIDITHACTDLRVIKTSEEIRHITKACAHTDHFFSELVTHLPKCKTELDVASILKHYLTNYNLAPSFPAIVATGKNAATPHHVPSNAKLNGFTVIDFGIVYKNYCSDMTRTVYFGKPTAKEKAIYTNLLAVQNASVERAMPGTTLEAIHDRAKKTLGKPFIHNIGHSLGIEVHDAQPRPLPLIPGTVITIEPGVYTKGHYGIRIEDDVLVTRKQPIRLTNSTRELLAIRRKL